MKRLLLSIVLVLSLCAPALAGDVFVHGYNRKDGTHVDSHYRTAPDNSTLNNYSTRGNYNPHTGAMGTSNPYGHVQGSGVGGNYPFGNFQNQGHRDPLRIR